ncbi:septum formation family protein [Promicromonospora sukumoe]
MTSPSPRTGLIAAAMILFWPVGLAALVATNRAARAEGSGDGARRAGRRARRHAWTGVALGGTLLALVLAGGVTLAVRHAPALQALAGTPAAVRSAAVTEQVAVPVGVLDLRSGDCFVAPATEQQWNELAAVEVVPCGDTHDATVIAVHESEKGDYPGIEAVQSAAWDTCGPASARYLRASTPLHADVRLKLPNEHGWERGYRTTACILVASEPVRGSLRDRPDLVTLTPQDGENA